jgi:nitrite reductase/ring-hydroxylating ferredoxin subunit
MTWHTAAQMGEIDEQTPHAVTIETHLIALFRRGDQVYATSNVCTHEHVLLSDGYLDGDCIECPLHQGSFNIVTGEAVSPPVVVDIKTYPVKIEGDSVLVQLD